MIRNLHGREVAAPVDEVGLLIDSLASEKDLLWPSGAWPALRLDGDLRVGAAGGHGPVRYVVTQYEPGRRITFRFTRPRGFEGSHAFTASYRSSESTLLQHELVMKVHGTAVLTWPLFYRPLHNSLIEESLDRAERECGIEPERPAHRTAWTRTLRRLLSRRLG